MALQAQLEPPLPRPAAETDSDLLDDPDYARVWAALDFDPSPVETVVQRTGLQPREVSSMLLLLELNGLVEIHAGGRVCRRG